MVETVTTVGKSMSVSDAARSTLDGFLEVFRRLEIEPFMAYFCEDASVFYPFQKWPKKVHGRDDIGIHFKEVFDSHRKGAGPSYLEITPINVEVVPLGANALVTFHLDRNTGIGRRTLLLVGRDEGFRILHLHASNIGNSEADDST